MPQVAAEVSPARSRRDTRQERRLDMRTELLKVTPDMAKKWLTETSTLEEVRNRAPSPGKVALFAENMTRGNWEISHQGYALYQSTTPVEEGGTGGKTAVLDGQHRMWAQVKSNQPIYIPVTSFSGGTLRDALEIMKTFDRGQTRSIGQVLRIEQNVSRAATRCAVMRYLLMFLRGGGASDRSVTKNVVDADVIDAVHRYERDLDWFCSLKRGAGNTFLSAPIGAALVYAHSVPDFEGPVAHLGNQLSRGEGLFEGDPAMSFRDWIIREGSDNLLRRPETRMKLMRVTFKVVKLAVQNKRSKQLHDDISGFEFVRQAKEQAQRRRTTNGANGAN